MALTSTLPSLPSSPRVLIILVIFLDARVTPEEVRGTHSRIESLDYVFARLVRRTYSD